MRAHRNLVLPNLAQGWECRDAGKTCRLFLRPGLKWSDGVPHTADDYLFWFKYVFNYPELTPVRPGEYDFEMVKVDDYTVDFKFDQPAPYFINYLAHWRGAHMFLPAHFLKRYHPEFTPLAQLASESKREGYMTCRNYLTVIGTLIIGVFLAVDILPHGGDSVIASDVDMSESIQQHRMGPLELKTNHTTSGRGSPSDPA